jgi:hypothetical protein
MAKRVNVVNPPVGPFVRGVSHWSWRHFHLQLVAWDLLLIICGCLCSWVILLFIIFVISWMGIMVYVLPLSEGHILGLIEPCIQSVWGISSEGKMLHGTHLSSPFTTGKVWEDVELMFCAAYKPCSDRTAGGLNSGRDRNFCFFQHVCSYTADTTASFVMGEGPGLETKH